MSFRLLRVLIAVCIAIPAVAQTQPAAPASPQQEVDPLKRPIDKKTQKQQSKRLMSETYGKWPDSDAVRWIITDEEREAFLKLSNDDEREQFIEAFWGRRDPTPDTIENEYKEEHYRRVAYANEHFSAGKPGWLTDRGHIYIAWGPPDQIESHPSGGYVTDGRSRPEALPSRSRSGVTAISRAATSGRKSRSSSSTRACAAITT